MVSHNILVVLRETCALLVLLVLGYFALFVPPEQAANLPAMDEGQYAISAWNLFNRGVYAVTLNHNDYPAHFPYGFPVLLLPAFALAGPFIGNVTYMNFLLNMGVIILTYVVGRMVAGWIVGWVAALFLLGNDVFLHFSHRIYSQGAIALFGVVACLLLFKILDRQDQALPIGLLIGLGITLGYLSSLHATAVCLSLAAVLSLCLIHRANRRRLLRTLVPVGGICTTFIAIQLEYQRRTFGGLLRSGHEYWNEVPALQLFSREHLLSLDFSPLANIVTQFSPTSLWRFFDTNNITYYFSGLLGLRESSVLYSPVAVVLILLGGSELLRRRQGERGRLLIAYTIAALGLLLGLLTPYYYQSFRFLIPVLPLLGIAAAVGMMSLWRDHGHWSKRKVRAPLVVLLGLLFFADLSSSYVSGGMQYAEAELREPRGRMRMARYACVQLYNSLAEGNAVIVSTLDINYISHFVLAGTGRTYLPLVRNISYVNRDSQAPNENWRDLGLPVAAESPRALASLLRQGIPVYTDDLREETFAEEYRTLRSLFDWSTAGKCSSFRIYRLQLRDHGAAP